MKIITTVCLYCVIIGHLQVAGRGVGEDVGVLAEMERYKQFMSKCMGPSYPGPYNLHKASNTDCYRQWKEKNKKFEGFGEIDWDEVGDFFEDVGDAIVDLFDSSGKSSFGGR